MAANLTSLSSPFPKDLVMAVPRMMARAGSFAFITVPERLDSILGFRNGGSMIAEATGNGSVNIISSAFFAGSSSGTATPTAAAAAGGTPEGLGTFSFQQVRNFSGIFAYMTSKWALACFTLVSLQFVKQPMLSLSGRRLTLRRPSSLIELRYMLQRAVTSLCLGQYGSRYA